ncbi:MAG: winged helix-turn-helix domain-containing protein [Armatimonadetes bacterium]|nr:winged helix-turn-helix domain-containing protein [Armatimonadota bacterium]
MKKNDVQTGATYLVKVASNLVPVKIDREHDNGGWVGTSVKTGKTIRVKSAQRLRKCLDDAAPVAAKAKEATKDATDAPQRDTGERAATGGQRESNDVKPMSLLDAAAHLLSLGTGDPMRCKDIVDLAVARGLWTPGNGRTPANTLYASILREIKTKGDTSRFVKAERGKFALASKT